jgi:hypothetical protein
LESANEELVKRVAAAPIIVNGKIIGAVTTTVDVTGQRRAQAQVDNEMRPAVSCMTPGNQCLIAYQRSFNYGNGVYDSTVWGDLVGPTGLILPTFEISGAIFWDDEAPAVGAHGSGYLVAYEGDSAGDPTAHRHIYGTLLTPYTTLLPYTMR